jgi:hypothetical protein
LTRKRRRRCALPAHSKIERFQSKPPSTVDALNPVPACWLRDAGPRFGAWNLCFAWS